MTSELVAAIEAHHDEDTILIYADWLIEQGDPLGELIVLHRSTEIDPALPGVTRDFVRRHTERLLGDLGRCADSDFVLDWRLGLVDAVRVSSNSPAAIAAILDAVATAPVCRFVRELEIESYGNDYAPIEAQLVALGRPRTLQRIKFGRAGEYAMRPELFGAFPRMPKTDRAWEALEADIFPIDDLDLLISDDEPTLTDRTGAPIPLSASTLLHGLCREYEGRFVVNVADKVHATCGAERLDAWIAALIRAGKLFSDHHVFRGMLVQHGGPAVIAALDELLATTEEVAVARAVIAILDAMTSPAAQIALYRRLRRPTRTIDRSRPRRDFEIAAVIARISAPLIVDAVIYEDLLATGYPLAASLARRLPRAARWQWTDGARVFAIADAPEHPIWIAHPAELAADIALPEHQRRSLLPTPTLAAAQKVFDARRTRGDFVALACAAGFYTISDTAMQRQMRHRDGIHLIDLDLRTGKLDALEVPAVVLHELALDFGPPPMAFAGYPTFDDQRLPDGRTWTAAFDSYDQRLDTFYYVVFVGELRLVAAAWFAGEDWTVPEFRTSIEAQLAEVAASGVSNTAYQGIR